MLMSESRVWKEENHWVGASRGDAAAGGREHSRNLQHEIQPYQSMCSHRLLSQSGQGRLCKASASQTHPGMQDFRVEANHVWMRINGSFSTLCLHH